LKAGWAWGCLYLAAYGAWAWLFRSSVDSWARRRLGERLGVHVVWLQATAFPVEIWVWGVALHPGAPERALLQSRVALGSTAMCLAGAFLPTAALCLLLRWNPAASEELASALYLTTPLLLLVFVASHLKWRGPEPSEPPEPRGGPGSRWRPPSEPPGRLDEGRNS
jgi:hypothetical protein